METSRYYGGGYIAAFGVVHPSTLMQTSGLGYVELLYNLLSPKFLNRYVDQVVANMSKIDISGISFRDLGDTLHSDKKRTEMINREQAKTIVEAQYDKIDSAERAIMTSGGNLYALQYSDDLINIPMSHNPFFLIDEEIPFYAMVLHGYIDYSGNSINLNSTEKAADIALKLIELGASPHYSFTYDSANELKYTGLNRYHGTTFNDWKDEAIEVYHMVNDILKNVSGSAIIKHETIQPGIKRITYDNGKAIIINTTDDDAVVDGMNVAKKSYEMGAWK